ncbi:hypothetical protein CDAR_18711 [Caerostris darwini]|uniref:Uncharacterized protein n=1 Tax=Caerostris darwini TaxID=1538125 RepID=A0AAV4SYJ5_9ARAC|nr:hypothetical protein CDAR_18711 [Caerostris darwini]
MFQSGVLAFSGLTVLEDLNFSFEFSEGKLTKLIMYRIAFGGDLYLIMELLLVICSDLQCLQIVDVYEVRENTEKLTENLAILLQKSCNLEELHCSIPFDLKVLRNCKKLKHLKLCFRPKRPWTDFLEVKDNELQPSASLKSFTVCSYSVDNFTIRRNIFPLVTSRWKTCFPDHGEELSTILTLCPELEAVGRREKLLLVQRNANREIKESPKFLPNSPPRSCIWAGNYAVTETCFRIPTVVSLELATAFYSEIKKLFLDICDEICLIPLRKLTKLAYFGFFTPHYPTYIYKHLYPFLVYMGHQLTYLRLIFENDGISVNFLRRHCPNLKWLILHCSLRVDVKERIENFEYLEDITLSTPMFHHYDERSLEILLSKSVNLSALSMSGNASIPLTDKCLNKILEHHTFSKLKSANIGDCNLYKKGLQKFIAHAKNLETFTSVP